MKRVRPALLAAAAMLAGCGLAPLAQDQAIHLGPGQGVAGVTFDTLDPLSQVGIESKAGGARLEIPNVPIGHSLYLFVVPAGEYCFAKFQYGEWSFSGKGRQLACFAVPAGGLGYSGTLAPRAEAQGIVSHQVMDEPGFRFLLEQRYPLVARQFPIQTAEARTEQP
jgi:hypothetical protein